MVGALALRELGRIERTLFTLDWLQDIELRRRVQIGLNKGEAKNALARAVFFNRLGELRDRSFENQRYRASGLNLVVAAIVLWNTAYLERVVQALRDTGNADDSLLMRGSICIWYTFNRTSQNSMRPSVGGRDSNGPSKLPNERRASGAHRPGGGDSRCDAHRICAPVE